MLPASSTVGFKEWAVTVSALEKGEQVVLLRKGGIREDGKYFKVEHEGFFLYPTYDHQKSELVKTEFHDLYNSTLIDEDPDLVHLSSYAEVTEVIDRIHHLVIHHTNGGMLCLLFSHAMLDQVRDSTFLTKLHLQHDQHVVITLHRPSNVDDPKQLVLLLEQIKEMSNHFDIIWPIHPRTKSRIEAIERR